MTVFRVEGKGRAVVRAMLAMMRAKGDLNEALHDAANNYGQSSRAFGIVKAMVGAATSESGLSADVRGQQEEFFELGDRRSVLGQMPGLRRVAPRVRTVLNASASVGAFVGEGGGIPLIRGDFQPSTIVPLKVASLTVETIEAVRAETVEGEEQFQSDLIRTTSDAIDIAFLDAANSGTPGVIPAAITNGITPITVGSGDIEDIDRAIVTSIATAVIQGGDAKRLCILLNPILAFFLHNRGGSKYENVGVNGGDIGGVSVVTSNASPLRVPDLGSSELPTEFKIVVIDPGLIAVTTDGGDFKASEQGAVEMRDDPGQNAAAAAGRTMVSLWQSNLIALRMIRRIAWKPITPAAVVLVDGIFPDLPFIPAS
ncbi:hypothetical protein [Dongia rigui]|uniref:Phage major capsid protein n=1 Tax=Dongia rigui TaxID=940149 RepID=A0ABU5E1N5_9PROT|nr:hypothetical protein [Dongia rigui]MDY0873110.1 hypothetical protein [Dongia rigui]